MHRVCVCVEANNEALGRQAEEQAALITTLSRKVGRRVRGVSGTASTLDPGFHHENWQPVEMPVGSDFSYHFARMLG